MFKESFKYYKSKWPLPSYSEVIDTDNSSLLIKLAETAQHNDGVLPPGMIPLHEWSCYELNMHPGLIIIRNPFTPQGQRYWIARCLRDYTKPPNKVNLNTEMFTQSVIGDWWHELQTCCNKEEARRLKRAMRWATLGYHHDWDRKVYSEDRHTQMPSDLSKLSSFISKVLGCGKFNAEAAIVNYYPIGTTLAGHTDHSEINLEAPLFSFSFGQNAIFLIGGLTMQERPSALFLRSGDVVVMSREARLCYHAVPRIMKADVEPWNEFTVENFKRDQCEEDISYKENFLRVWSLDDRLYHQITDDAFWKPYENYINDSRININVRQVLHIGKNTL